MSNVTLNQDDKTFLIDMLDLIATKDILYDESLVRLEALIRKIEGDND